MYTDICTYIQTDINIHRYTDTYSCTQIYTHIFRQILIYTYIRQIYVQIFMYTDIYTDIQTDINIHRYTDTYSCTQKYTHIFKQILICILYICVYENIQTDIHIRKYADRYTYIYSYTQIFLYTDIQIDIQTDHRSFGVQSRFASFCLGL